MGPGTRAGIEWGNKKKKDSGQGDKKDLTRAQSFAIHFFLLAAHLFFFFTTSSSEFVPTWPGLSTTAGLAINSKSVISLKHRDLFTRYLVAEMWKPRAWRVLSAMSSVLKPPKSKTSVFQSWLKSKRYLSGSTLAYGFGRQLIMILFSSLIVIIRRDVVGASFTTIITLLKNILLQWG